MVCKIIPHVRQIIKGVCKRTKVALTILTRRVHDGRERNVGGHRSRRRTALQDDNARDDDADAHHQNAVRAGDHAGLVRGHLELRLQVLGQERVQTGDRQQMQHRRGRAEHQDVVAQLTANGFRKVAQPRTRVLLLFLQLFGVLDGAQFDRRRNAMAAQMLGEREHGDDGEEHQRGNDDETCAYVCWWVGVLTSLMIFDIAMR